MTALTVRSAIKKEARLRISGDFFEALDRKVFNIIKIAEERAKANRRQTLRPCDL